MTADHWHARSAATGRKVSPLVTFASQSILTGELNALRRVMPAALAATS
jgi:hypothetical protein